MAYTYKAAGAEAFTSETPTAVGTHTIKATIAETANYNSGEATAEFTITAADMNITATGHSGTYDGKAYGITVNAPDGATVKYGTKKGTYNLEASPTYSDAGTYKVHYQITMDNYNTIADSAIVEITKADINPSVSLEGWTFGETENAPSVTGNSGNGTVAYTYKTAGAEAFTSDIPTAVGTHTIKATIAETANYNSGEATAEFTITAADMNITATGHSGTYDGKAYGITVNAPDGATVKYGTKKGTYNLEASPTYSDAGTYKVHYQITMDNYNTIADSAIVEITKADINPSVSLEGWTFGKTENAPSVTGNSGNGTVAYTYKAAGAEAFTSEIPTSVGTHTIKATIAETANYNGGEATSSFTISNPTLDPEKDINFAEGQTFASYYNAEVDAMLPEKGLAAYMITGLEGNTLTIKAISYIPKGTPVLIEKTDANVTTEDPTNVSSNMLKYAEQEVTADGALYILYNGEYVKASGKIPAMKCYLKTTKAAGARRLIIGHNNGDDSTGINAIDNEQTPIDKWYDFNGNRINKPVKKGLYIKNGKKVVVK